MARSAFKPDSSFFKKIVIGAVGTRAICNDLAQHGHKIVELERGSMDTKLWKDIKRKRVRIPDLVCTKCGVRIESRAKTKAELVMSHSPTEAARAWDFGLTNEDWVAFPIFEVANEEEWSAGKLNLESSYWHERNWVQWRQKGCINYIRVEQFRSNRHSKSSTKGVTEGSETSLAWGATFSTRDGVVESSTAQKVKIRRASDGHCHTWTIPENRQILVSPGNTVKDGQIIASVVKPLTSVQLSCPNDIPENYITQLISSRELTQRFTGVKLARLLSKKNYCESIAELTADEEEDVYIRLEGVSYLTTVCEQSAHELFRRYLNSTDEQIQLEAVIALGESATSEAVKLLAEILNNETHPYFLRSAAAWSLSQVGSVEASKQLIQAFACVNPELREEALKDIVSIGEKTIPSLLNGLRQENEDIVAGCAEALRQQKPLPNEVITQLLEELHLEQPSRWVVWLFGHLPRERVAKSITELQDSAPNLHYAISLLWSFVESWISRRWELFPGGAFSNLEGFDVV